MTDEDDGKLNNSPFRLRTMLHQLDLYGAVSSLKNDSLFKKHCVSPPFSKPRLFYLSLIHIFQTNGAFLRMQERVFLFLQLRGDVALGVGQRLLADIAVFFLDLRRRALGHFDIIAEHPVVADFQRLNSSALAFVVFLLENPGFAFLLGCLLYTSTIQTADDPVLTH